VLPWVQAQGGVYRVNRRLSYAVGDGRVTFTTTGARVQVIPQELCELPMLRGFDDLAALQALADRFVQRELRPGEVITEQGRPADSICLIAHGKVNRIGKGKYGDETALDVLADGDSYSWQALLESHDIWPYTARAATPCTVLLLEQSAFEAIVAQSPSLRAHLEQFKRRAMKRQDGTGQAAIELAAGHSGEPVLPATYVDYETAPREYELSVAQTVLQIHTRVADLFNEPMNQTEQQLRLTVEALRERQEDELVNNREFGLLHNADLRQRVHTRSGPPTPDDMDELLARCGRTRRCSSPTRARSPRSPRVQPARPLPDQHRPRRSHGAGVARHPAVAVQQDPGRRVAHQLDPADADRREEPGRDRPAPGRHPRRDRAQPVGPVHGINDKAILSYLVTCYFSTAVLVPDALGILENVEIGRPTDHAGSNAPRSVRRRRADQPVDRRRPPARAHDQVGAADAGHLRSPIPRPLHNPHRQ